MSMENTVLILGAGFSKPYGYPTGPELLHSIKANYRNSVNLEEKILANDVNDFAPRSIDRFLNENNHHYRTGIQIIISEILRFEHESFKRAMDDSEDVIADILNTEDPSKPEYLSKLRFITFNYDRLLEWRILNKLRVSYGNDKDRIRSTFNRISIEHIHGSLPPLMQENNSDPFFVPYGLAGYNQQERQNAHDQIKLWAQRNEGIKTVFSNAINPNQRTVNTLKWAKRVFFLGFAFEELNMRKLGIGAPGVHYAWHAKTVGGTAFQVPNIDLNRIKKNFPFLANNLHNVTASRIFKDHYDLSDPSIDLNPKKHNYDCCEASAYQEQPLFNPLITTTQIIELTCPECNKAQGWRFKHAENSTLRPVRSSYPF